MKTNNLMTIDGKTWISVDSDEFEELNDLPEAISFIYSSSFNKQSIKKNHMKSVRKYNHTRKMRRKYNKIKWESKDVVVSYS